jgi:predicted DCC family thiol-disulfide oxidoreductase YuxK
MIRMAKKLTNTVKVESGRNEQATIIYDGDCQTCQRLTSLAKTHDHKISFRFIKYQDLQGSDINADIDLEEFSRSVGYIDSGGRAALGSPAVAEILQHFQGGWKLMGLIMSLPIIRIIAGFFYRLFARHRHSFSKLLKNTVPRKNP